MVTYSGRGGVTELPNEATIIGKEGWSIHESQLVGAGVCAVNVWLVVAGLELLKGDPHHLPGQCLKQSRISNYAAMKFIFHKLLLECFITVQPWSELCINNSAYSHIVKALH